MARYGAVDPCSVIQELLKAATGELLSSTLKSIEGAKDLVIEQDLIFPLDHIASAGVLKKTCGVEKIYKLEATAPPAGNKQCAYLVRSTIANMKMIANHITHHKQNKRECKYYIICIPRKAGPRLRADTGERRGLWLREDVGVSPGPDPPGHGPLLPRAGQLF